MSNNGLMGCDVCGEELFWKEMHKILRRNIPRYLCDKCYKAYMKEQEALWDLHLAPFRGYY